MIIRLTIGLNDEEDKEKFIVIGQTMKVPFSVHNQGHKEKIENSAKALAHSIYSYTCHVFRDTVLQELEKLCDERRRNEADYKALVEEGEKLLKEFQVQQKEEEEDE